MGISKRGRTKFPIYSYVFLKRIVLTFDIWLKQEQIFKQIKNYERCPEPHLNTHLKNLQFLGLRNGADLFSYTRKKKKSNFGSELPILSFTVRTLLGNKIAEHLISDIKDLYLQDVTYQWRLRQITYQLDC